VKTWAWFAYEYYSGPKGKDSRTFMLPTDNTLVCSLTLRMVNGHEPVEQKAREKSVKRPMEYTNNNSKSHIVP
jgi:hypothetical protein